VYSAAIPPAPLSGVNSFAIVGNEGEQYIAATDQGLFHSDDHGHTWVGYERSGRLHQEPVEQTRTRLPGSKTHAVHAMTVILINFNAAEI
jgi:hypothetical protein